MIRVALVALILLGGCADRVRHTCETAPEAQRCPVAK
jgi:hypothetical protein